MPRHARIVIPGVPHHVTQRGNNRQVVFRDDQDREFYLRYLAKKCRQHRVELSAWCLMTNHVHLVLTPSDELGLGRLIGETHRVHAQVFNLRHERIGHLWHGRFFSTPMDEVHTVRAMLYVERNPVRAGLVKHPEDHPWSSAAAHLAGVDERGLINARDWSMRYPPKIWRTMLREQEPEPVLTQIRCTLASNVPLVTPERLADLERSFGRLLRPRRRGRPESPR